MAGLALPAVFALAVEVIYKVTTHTAIVARVLAAVINIYKSKPIALNKKFCLSELCVNISVGFAHKQIVYTFWYKADGE